ncbi:nucleotidyltransferase family protein [Flavobacterium sp.]|uniref:nucleotidyltransferase family protein n=1 Tax=Flavobacterium sp. TaxID=239 RepID=UPI0035290EE3
MIQFQTNIKNLKSFQDIIVKLDSFGVGFLAVVDDSNTLVGIVTDGDIRKALLNRKKEVSEIINYNPITLPHTTPRHQIKSFLEEKRRLHVPLIDENSKLVEVYLLNNFSSEYHPNYVVIMAGGLGSRLGDLTRNVPKPMLQIKGKPMVEYIIESFKNQGFNKFIFCINYKKEYIQDYFSDGNKLGVSIEYIEEQTRLGTAGALSLIKKNKFEVPFFVVNGDVISNIDYLDLIDFYTLSKADAVMCVKEMSHTNPYAEVEYDEHFNLLDLKEKPTKKFDINLGIYLLNEKVRQLLPENEFFDMPSLFIKAKESKLNVKVFRANDDWMDIGLPTDYKAIQND